jgi:hypothetical protein
MKKYSILVGWEGVTTEELVAFHDVTLNLNMARCMKCSVKKTFSLNSGLILQFCKDIVSRKRFLQLYWGLHVSPLSKLVLLIGKCSPELSK